MALDIERRKQAASTPDSRSIDSMFFDDIDTDEDDTEFDLDDIDDLTGIIGNDDDLREMDDDDIEAMLNFADDEDDDTQPIALGPSGAGSRAGRQADSRSQGLQLDDEAMMEADLAASEGRMGGGTARQQQQPKPQPQRRQPSMGGDASAAKSQPSPLRGFQDDGLGDEPDISRKGKATKTVTKSKPKRHVIHEETEKLVVPQWVVSINSKLQGNVAHAFLLEGNIRDYMVQNISIKDGIIMTLDPYQDAFEVTASYDQAHGLRFDTYSLDGNVSPEEYQARFIEMMNEAQDALGIPRTADIPSDPVTLFSIISKIVEMPGEEFETEEGEVIEQAKLLLFFDYPEMLIPQSNGTPREVERQLAIIINDMCRSELADDSGCCIIMMCDDIGAMSERVRSTSSRVDRVNVPMPLLDARKDFIYNVLSVPENKLSDGRGIFECDEGADEEYLAINTAGLANFQIEDIVLRALADDVPITPDLIKERKNEIIMTDYNEILEIMEPKYGFAEVGGMQQVKEFFMDEVINPIHRGELEGVPMGVLLMGPPGTAKALQNGTQVVYSDGVKVAVKAVENLCIGDYVFNRKGELTKVTAIVPMGEKALYKVCLKDGREVITSGEHLWGYWHTTDRSQGPVTFLDTITTEEMLEKGIRWPGKKAFRWYLPINDIVEMPAQVLPLDPYVVGALAGDGSTTVRQAILISADEPIVERVAKGLNSPFYQVSSQKEYDQHHYPGRAYGWKFAFSDEMKEEYIAYRKAQGHKVFPTRIKWIPGEYVVRNVPEIHCKAHEKSLPDIYKFSSVQQRLALLQGFFDTDGSASFSNGRLSVKFVTSSCQLCEDIREILFSLGLSSSVCQHNPKKHQTSFMKRPSYEVSVHGKPERLMELFGLERKRQVIRTYIDYASSRPTVNRKHHNRIPVVAIEKLPDTGLCTCIKVDDPEGLFLVTRQYVVTHNTLLSKAVAKESNMNCVNLNLNRILNKYVGGSERNLDRALDCAIAMEPTIIFIDEIDEALPKRNGADQTGISQRINKRLLEFMSNTEHRGQVMILAATNYPEKIDPAFKRAGRFDNRLPMFAPGKYDRARILHISAAKARYTISQFISPDTEMPNPFRHLSKWLSEHADEVDFSDAVYEMSDFEYERRNSLGVKTGLATVQIPTRLLKMIGPTTCSLEDFYRACDILIPEGELPSRSSGDLRGSVLSDADYRKVLVDALRRSLCEQREIVPNNDKLLNVMARFIAYKQLYFDIFAGLTIGKTGAELDVVINKCISLYRKWKIAYPERFQRILNQKLITDERDIPWFIVEEACKKTTAAVSGIKSMEDYALIDTSDTDYIPDEEYGRLSSAKVVSYRERQETLLARMRNFDENSSSKADLLKS